MNPSTTAGPSSAGVTDFCAELTTMFKCQKCGQHVLKPIPQCRMGHLLCSPCYKRLNNCPVCSDILDLGMRNTAMENISRLVKFPCRFVTTGCTEMFTGHEMAVHQDRCVHQFVKCSEFAPKDDCAWMGPYSDLLHHLSRGHPKRADIQMGNPIQLSLYDCDIISMMNIPVIQHCHNKDFIHLLVASGVSSLDLDFHYVVWLVDHKITSSQFKGKFELSGPNGTLICDCMAWDPFCPLELVKNNCPSIKPSYITAITTGHQYKLTFTVSRGYPLNTEDWFMAKKGCRCDYECNLQNMCPKKIESGSVNFSQQNTCPNEIESGTFNLFQQYF